MQLIYFFRHVNGTVKADLAINLQYNSEYALEVIMSLIRSIDAALAANGFGHNPHATEVLVVHPNAGKESVISPRLYLVLKSDTFYSQERVSILLICAVEGENRVKAVRDDGYG